MNGLPRTDAQMKLRTETDALACLPNEHGVFTFETIPPGRVCLQATIPSGSKSEPAFVMERDLEVTAGGLVTENFDIFTGAFFGYVNSSSNGRPISSISVETWSLGQNGMKPVRMTTRTRPDGSFSFDRLPAGEYKVKATARARGLSYWDSPGTVIKSVEVLPLGNVGPLNLVLHDRTTVSGKVIPAKVDEMNWELRVLPLGSENRGKDSIQTVESNNTIRVWVGDSRVIQVDGETGRFTIQSILPGAYEAVLLLKKKGEDFNPFAQSAYHTILFHVPPEGLSEMVFEPEKMN
jgi:hypothetical protein